MGTGDWNDGMNRVGEKGKGESVWDAWFLIAGLTQFAKLSEARGDSARVEKCRQAAEGLRKAVEASAWDGRWYRRAYFDDGSPLGSAQNDECRIDSIAQTWAVISGAGDPGRPRQAMAGVDARLVQARRPRDPPVHPAVRPRQAPPRLHQGLSAGHPGEWRPVYPCRHLGGRRHLAPGPRRSRTAPSSTSSTRVRHTADDPQGVEPVQGRALCRGGGRVRPTAPHRPGRLDVVHRLGLVALAGRRRGHPRIPGSSGDRLAIDPCLPKAWPGFELTYRHGSATYRVVVENPRGVERGVVSVTLTTARPSKGAEIPLGGRRQDARGPRDPRAGPRLVSPAATRRMWGRMQSVESTRQTGRKDSARLPCAPVLVASTAGPSPHSGPPPRALDRPHGQALDGPGRAV